MELKVHAAKTHFSRLLGRVERGESVVIARGDKPVARLIPFVKARARRVPGAYRGQGWVADDFDAPLPARVLSRFRG